MSLVSSSVVIVALKSVVMVTMSVPHGHCNFDAIIPKFCSEFPNPIAILAFISFFFVTFLICFHEYFLVLNSPIRFS